MASRHSHEVSTVEVVIEIPQGSRNKFEWDEKLSVIRLDRRIPGAVSFPTHYGFVPRTLAPDGDPIDALVLAEPPLYPGVWLTARPIGVGWLADDGILEPKILCVPQNDPGAASIRKLDDLPPLVLREIEQFFDVYKLLEPGKHTRFARWGGRKEAAGAIEKAREAAHDAQPSVEVITMSEKVRDVMSTDVIVCDGTTSVADVARIMRDGHVGDVLVSSDGKLRGIATDRDIVVRCVAERGNVEQSGIGDLLTEDPVMVEPETTLEDAMKQMVDHSIRRLPVVEDGRLVGVVSLGDLAQDVDDRSALGSISAARPNS